MGKAGFAIVCWATALACTPGAVVAQATIQSLTQVSTGGAGTLTREVAKYLELEGDLLTAVSRRDRQSVNSLLANDFSSRSASADSEDANAWLAKALAAANKGASIRELSVRKVADLDLVSFYLVHQGSTTFRSSAEFVVDAWRAADGKLMARFANPAKAPLVRDKRPDGRG